MKANNTAEGGFEVYKGIQAPLMFKGFKGRYIYMGAGIMFLGFIVTGIMLSFFSTVVGIVTLCLIWGGGYVYISTQQKKGLYKKINRKGIFIVVNKYKIRKLE